MTDKPSGEPSGDAEFQRWFAEQDPFGNTRAKRNTKEPETPDQRVPASGLFRFGLAIPAAILIFGVLIFGFAAGVVLRSIR